MPGPPGSDPRPIRCESRSMAPRCAWRKGKIWRHHDANNNRVTRYVRDFDSSSSRPLPLLFKQSMRLWELHDQDQLSQLWKAVADRSEQKSAQSQSSARLRRSSCSLFLGWAQCGSPSTFVLVSLVCELAPPFLDTRPSTSDLFLVLCGFYFRVDPLRTTST